MDGTKTSVAGGEQRTPHPAPRQGLLGADWFRNLSDSSIYWLLND